MPSSHLIPCCPLLLLPPILPSIRVFSNESTLHMRWPKYWSFSFSIIPSKEIPGLISFRMDWLDLLAVQGTLKSLLQHHSSKASILQCSAFFTVQLSNPYMTTGKPIALTRRTFVGKVISLLFNMLSRLVMEMATHSSIFAWRIPQREEPSRLQSMGLQSQMWLSDYNSDSLFSGARLPGNFLVLLCMKCSPSTHWYLHAHPHLHLCGWESDCMDSTLVLRQIHISSLLHL